MKILVPVKRVVDYNIKIRIKGDGVSTSLSTLTFGSPRSDPNCLTISTNDCVSFVMSSLLC